jgi:hypothetical protein
MGPVHGSCTTSVVRYTVDQGQWHSGALARERSTGRYGSPAVIARGIEERGRRDGSEGTLKNDREAMMWWCGDIEGRWWLELSTLAFRGAAACR